MAGITNQTPRQLGYRMPAEWEPHEATWLAWPHIRSDWPGKFSPIQWVYADVVSKLARFERVHMIVNGETAEAKARQCLEKAGADLDAVVFFHCNTNRGWTRDYCPLFVKRPDTGEVAITKWRFNGWAKYRNWRADDSVVACVAPQLEMPIWHPGLVLEGGAVDVNGEGVLMATEECLLSEDVQVRNPGLSRQALEEALCEYLGITRVVWLKRGIAGDDTHGHIDDLARFVNPRTIVIVSESDPRDENYEPLRENLELLRASGEWDVHTLPMPRPVYFEGQRLPASYANFYIANGIVLVPTFNDPADRVALNTLAALFPDREVVGIHSLDLVLGLGTLHCMTMQQPARG
jgi:agmatine deiminase